MSVYFINCFDPQNLFAQSNWKPKLSQRVPRMTSVETEAIQTVNVQAVNGGGYGRLSQDQPVSIFIQQISPEHVTDHFHAAKTESTQTEPQEIVESLLGIAD